MERLITVNLAAYCRIKNSKHGVKFQCLKIAELKNPNLDSINEQEIERLKNFALIYARLNFRSIARAEQSRLILREVEIEKDAESYTETYCADSERKINLGWNHNTLSNDDL